MLVYTYAYVCMSLSLYIHIYIYTLYGSKCTHQPSTRMKATEHIPSMVRHRDSDPSARTVPHGREMVERADMD